MSGKTVGKRMIHYDLLRIVAAFSVVMLHSAAQLWYTLDIYSADWLIANSYDAVFRFGVPVFVMISGALFLNPDYVLDTKRLYKHNIFRYLMIYIVWSCIYGVWDSRTFQFSEVGWKPYIREMLAGRYHLWFLPMIIGIYMLLPILKSWVNNADKKNLKYFLVLFFVFQIGSETLRAMTVADELHSILDTVQIEMVCSYIGYFVWGYYLSHIGIGNRLRKVCYVCAIPAVLCNILLGNYLAHRAGIAVGAIYDSFGLFTFVIATVLFLVCREHISKKSFSDRSKKLIGEISANTLGIYVLHIGLMEGLESMGFHSMMLPGIVGIPLYAIICFVVCMLISALLRRIPFVGKYIC